MLPPYAQRPRGEEAMTEVLFRILKDREGYTRVWQIVDGCVAELTPLPEDEKRGPGIYDAGFNNRSPHHGGQGRPRREAVTA